MFDVDLRTIFTPAAVAQDLQVLPIVQSQILDTYYPESKRSQHPLPVIAADELAQTIGTVPVVKRGTASTPIAGGSDTITYIEPQGIEPKTFVSASELNNLKVMLSMQANGLDPVAVWRQSKENLLRLTARRTIDALASQSLSGAISYPMKIEGGYGTYTVNFGTILTTIITSKWDQDATTIANILQDCINMQLALQAKGYGSNIRWEVGTNVYVALCKKVLAVANDQRMVGRLDEKGVTIGGFTFVCMAGSYLNPQTGAATVHLGAKKVRAIDLDAPFKLIYTAIDDLEAGLLPMPFFVNPVQKRDPSGYDLIGKTKPLPCPVVNAICESAAIS